MIKYSIGLDLGINNVGWSIVNLENNKIEKYGVRQFSISESAEERRNIRNSRRRKKRKDLRGNDILKLCSEIGFPNSIKIDPNLIEKRYLSINEKINEQDIVNILYYLVSHRGYIPFGDEEVEFVDLMGKLPCEYYYDLYKNSDNNKYRALNKTVKNSDNIKEIETMLKKQGEFYKNITDDFIFKVVEIFLRKRKFWEGPGSINSLTKYGRFKDISDVEKYNFNKLENPNYQKYIFEDLVGNCKIEIGEKCTSSMNFYAEKYNLLNDFINISFKSIEELSNQNCFKISDNSTHKLNKKGLELVIEYCLDKKTISLKTLFKDLFNCSIDNIYGYRVDKNRNIEMATFNNYRSLRTSFIENDANIEIFKLENISVYNKIIDAIMVCPGIVELIKMIDGSIITLTDNDKKALISILKKQKSKLKYHSFSEKHLKRACEDMLNYEQNYMQVSRKFDYEKKMREQFINKYNSITSNQKIKNITSIFVNDIIASPQVKKTLRQAIKVINAIIQEKKCYPDTIVIESAKEMNGEERKKELERIQKQKEKLRKDASSYLRTINPSLDTEKNVEKIMLYNEMNGICPYCGENVKVENLLNGSIEIEHILPYSKTFDNSYENKTISCSNCNSNKSNNVPLYWLNNDRKEKFIERINNNKNISNIKKDRFLFNEDIDKYVIRFFNSNLRDVSYATKELANQIEIFNNYLKLELGEAETINILSVPGQLTGGIRKHFDLVKDRDLGEVPYHHAVDASIMALLPTTELGKLMIPAQNDKKFYVLPDKKNKMDKIGYKLYEMLNKDSEYNDYVI